MSQKIVLGHRDVLVAVDIQNDFCPGGSLSLPRGHEVVPMINRLAERFDHVVLTQDWHPTDHLSFASQHSGKKPHETILVEYGPQIPWPDHCVRATRGAEFHKDLHVPNAGLVLRKGIHRTIDSYSTFYENDRKTPTGLVGYLRDRGFTRVFLVGLAFDFCVRYSAEDAHREGFAVVVVEHAGALMSMDQWPLRAKAWKDWASFAPPPRPWADWGDMPRAARHLSYVPAQDYPCAREQIGCSAWDSDDSLRRGVKKAANGSCSTPSAIRRV